MDVQSLRRVASDPAAFQAALVIPSAHGPRRFADCMADFQRERFASINPSLIAVANGKMPECGRHWWEATKGASKDSDLAVCLLWLLAFTKRPLVCQVGAADQDQAGELKKAAKDILRLNLWLSQRVAVQSWRIVCEATESACEIIAADISGSHGARPDVLILNELSHVTKQEFAENLIDNSAKVPQGLVVIATNAGFTGTWQSKWREIARSSKNWNVHIRAEPSPWLNAADMEEAKLRNPPARFMRLWYGVWASGAGDALDPSDIAAATKPDLAPLKGRSGALSFVAGLDLGISQDHSALIVLGCDGATQRIRLADLQSWRPQALTGRVDLEAVEAAVADAHHRFGLECVCYDPYQAALMAQRLTKQGVNMREMTFVGRNLHAMANTMLETFRSRRIDLYHHPRLLSDLSRLTIVEKSYGFRLEATRDADGHADTATALAIALPTAIEWCEFGGKMIWEGMVFYDDRRRPREAPVLPFMRLMRGI
jgi:phage terminase large subunit-like protein